MDVTETKPENACSKCGENKTKDKFIQNRNICKECRNHTCREKYKKNVVCSELTQTCKSCEISQQINSFHKMESRCKTCVNAKRREKYKTDDERRKKAIKQATDYKHNKIIERQKLKEETIGIDNKKCNYCDAIKHTTKFRHNRLKCRDCERDDPKEKFKRSVRSRIYLSLKKDKHTIEYLGCSSNEYLKWILTNNNDYTLANRGKEWHIDHVIPLSTFDLEDEEEQLVAFNWRNTMPLAAKDNLSKNNRIIPQQIEDHYRNLIDYHKENKIKMPQTYINLFAKYLVAGNPPKLSLPLTFGNICEEHG
jgi:hypothetical protein